MRLFKYMSFVWACSLLSCSGGEDNNPPPAPEPPSATVLVFPFANSECTTGVDINNEISEVTFEWQASDNTDLYTLNLINLNTSVPQTIATTSLSATLGISKGAPFSWSVTSTNDESEVSAVSENWLFYNAGSITSYPPFPATIISPESGATVLKNGSDDVIFSWIGADVEDDIESYEMFFSETSPDDLLTVYLGSEPAHSINGLTSGAVYYWKIITTDVQGNTSDSGVYDFRVE